MTPCSRIERSRISGPFLGRTCQTLQKAHHFQLWRSRTTEERTTLCDHNLAFCSPVLEDVPADGAQLTPKGTRDLKDDDDRHPDKVLAFLKRWAPGAGKSSTSK